LRKLSWDIKTAYEANLSGKIADVNLLIHARGENRIYITFDELRGESGVSVGRELRRHGGNVVQIHGGADQDEYRIVGKLLFHYPDWYPFQIKHDGVTIISDIKHNCINYAPGEWHHKYHKLDAEQFTAYLEKQKRKPYKRRPHKGEVPPSQLLLT
jgi:hypothetical protein